MMISGADSDKRNSLLLSLHIIPSVSTVARNLEHPKNCGSLHQLVSGALVPYRPVLNPFRKQLEEGMCLREEFITGYQSQCSDEL